MNEHHIKNGYQNMLVKDLKKILNDLPPRCKHREHFANVHAIVGVKFIKNEN